MTSMAFRLDLQKEPTSAARKTLNKRLTKAAARAERGDPDEALHDARKDLKKSRSLLRLLRPALPGELYDQEMATLREIARALSAARDAEVLPATLTALRESCPNEVPEVAFVTLEMSLLKVGDGSAAGQTLQERVGDLEEATHRVEQWALHDLDWDDIVRRLATSYRRGQRAMEAARSEPSDERLHEWRKRVKDLLYQSQLLADAWPAVLEVYAAQAHELADLLGDDHDLAVLLSTIESDGEAPPAVEPIVRLARRRRDYLQTQARRLGGLLYAEPPKAFRQWVAAMVAARRSQDEGGDVSFDCAA